MRMLQRLWKDDAGFIVSAELILVATIAVIGMVVGLNAVRNSMTSELADIALAFESVNQSYVIDGVQGHAASTSGTQFVDAIDYCSPANNIDPANQAAQCITQNIPPVAEGGAQTQPSLN